MLEHSALIFSLATVFGLFMAWGIGANDVANAMGTSVGSKALTLKQVIIIAAIFEGAGAVFAGGHVTQTIRGSILDPMALAGSPGLLIDGMLAALLSAGTWLLIASFKGWPVSTTHSIVGAIVGFGLVVVGPHAIHWHKILLIALSWIVTPVMSGVLAFLLFKTVLHFILDDDAPLVRARRLIPVYIFLVIFVIAAVTLVKGLKHLGLDLSYGASLSLAAGIGLLGSLVGAGLLRRVVLTQVAANPLAQVERAFGVLMIFTACAMAFAHGSNDVANAIGPLAAIIEVLQHGADVGSTSTVPLWVLLLGAGGIVLGLATYGYRVIATIGEGITELTPTRGFAAELATACTVVIASGAGLPISTTQTLVGAVLGVGMARGIGALNLNVVRSILLSWVITLPVGAGFAVGYFFILKYALGN